MCQSSRFHPSTSPKGMTSGAMRTKLLKLMLPSALLLASLPLWAQSCQTRDEMSDQARTALDNAAKQTFDEAAQGNLNGLRTSSIPTLNFDSDVAAPVNDNKDALHGAS